MIVPHSFPEMNTFVKNFVSEYVTIQGNIGAGKSTLLNILKTPKFREQLLQKFGGFPILFIDEPVIDWTVKKYENNTKSALDYYYEDKIRWGLSFQIKAFTTRMMNIVNETSKLKEMTVCLSERSMTSDKKVFLETIKPKIKQVEIDIYDEFYDLMCIKLNQLEKRMIVMESTPQECLYRIQQRGREAEKDINEDYLIELHNNHQKMIEEFEKNGGIVYRFNWPYEEDKSNLEKHVQQFLDLI